MSIRADRPSCFPTILLPWLCYGYGYGRAWETSPLIAIVPLWRVPSKSLSRGVSFTCKELGKSGAALAVQHVQVARRHGDPGAAGEGLRGDLLVAQDAQTVPRPPRRHSRRPG